MRSWQTRLSSLVIRISVNALIFSEWSDGKHVEPELPIRPDNLLLDIGPRAECMIPPIMEERLPTLVSARSDLVHALNS